MLFLFCVSQQPEGEKLTTANKSRKLCTQPQNEKRYYRENYVDVEYQ